MSRYVAISACLLAGSASLAAVEVADLRFGFGVAPMPDEQSGTFTATGGGTHADHIDYAGRAGTSFVISGAVGRLEPVGVIFGAEGRYSVGEAGFNRMTIDGLPVALDTVPESRYTESTFALNTGVGWAVTPTSHVELVALAGVSWITIDAPASISSTNQNTQKGRGNGILLGVRAGWYVTMDSRWQLGAEVEWTRTHADTTTDYLDGRAEYTVETSGPSARVVLGYRF